MRKVSMFVIVLLLVACAGQQPAPTTTPPGPPNLNMVSSPDQAKQVLLTTIDMFRQIVLNAEKAHPDRVPLIRSVETDFKAAAKIAFEGIEAWRSTGNNAKYMAATTEVTNKYSILGGSQ